MPSEKWITIFINCILLFPPLFKLLYSILYKCVVNHCDYSYLISNFCELCLTVYLHVFYTSEVYDGVTVYLPYHNDNY